MLAAGTAPSSKQRRRREPRERLREQSAQVRPSPEHALPAVAGQGGQAEDRPSLAPAGHRQRERLRTRGAAPGQATLSRTFAGRLEGRTDRGAAVWQSDLVPSRAKAGTERERERDCAVGTLAGVDNLGRLRERERQRERHTRACGGWEMGLSRAMARVESGQC